MGPKGRERGEKRRQRKTPTVPSEANSPTSEWEKEKAASLIHSRSESPSREAGRFRIPPKGVGQLNKESKDRIHR